MLNVAVPDLSHLPLRPRCCTHHRSQGLLRKLRVPELKGLCRQYNLPISGRKDDLYQRCRNHLTSLNGAAYDEAVQALSTVADGMFLPYNRTLPRYGVTATAV